MTPWNIPDQKYVDHVVAFAKKGSLFIFDVGYFKIKAFALLSQVGAYFLSRLNHQVNIYEGTSPHLSPLDLVSLLKTVTLNIIEKEIFIGEKERVPARLIAVRLPEDIVNEHPSCQAESKGKRVYSL